MTIEKGKTYLHVSISIWKRS